MRIITVGRLKKFWENYPDAEGHLRYWVEKMKGSTYQTPNEVIEDNPKADIVGNGRIVFNICGNKYRLIAKFEYQKQLIYIRFIDTHKEYDKIENIEHI